jgi:signal peptidase II
MRLALTARFPYFGLVLGVWALDQWTKGRIQEVLPPGASRTVLEGWFELTHLHNTGVAFGLFSGSDSSVRVWLLSGVALVAAAVVGFYSFRTPASDRGVQCALALILAGTLGNLYDRLTQGYVTDFLYFHWESYYWPAFNIADTAITTGVGLLALGMLLEELGSRR